MKRNLVYLALAVALAGCGTGEEDEATGGGSNTDQPVQSVMLDVEPTTVVELSPSDSVTAEVNVELTGAAPNDIVVNYSVSDDTALAGSEFESSEGTVTISKGERRGKISIPIISNNIYGSDKRFVIAITTESDNATVNTSSAYVTIENNDDMPTVSFEREALTVSENAGEISFNLLLSAKSEESTSVKYELAGTALDGQDYEIDASNFEIDPLTKKQAIPLKILQDSLDEGGETVVITLTQPSGITLGDDKVLNLIINGNTVLPDTGVRSYFDGQTYDRNSPDSVYRNQDAEYGKDAGADGLYDADGFASASYSKLDIDGNVLDRSASTFSCIRDNATGVVYEVLPNTEGNNGPNAVHWRNNTYTYLWHETDSTNNGGNAGGTNQNELVNVEGNLVGSTCEMPGSNSQISIKQNEGCTTANYTRALNQRGYCGFDDWRLATVNELQSISIFEYNQTLDDNYFTDVNGIPGDSRYLSGTPSADNRSAAWCVELSTGRRMLCNKTERYHVRAARSAN